MNESFLETLKIVPAGVLILNNKNAKIKFANNESCEILIPSCGNDGSGKK
jgi:hypothetical protein